MRRTRLRSVAGCSRRASTCSRATLEQRLVKCWVAGLVLVSSCAWTTRSPSPAVRVERQEILVAAGDSLLATIRDTVLFAADVATSEALGPAARRLGRSLTPSPGEVWCEDRTRAGRVVGLTVALTL